MRVCPLGDGIKRGAAKLKCPEGLKASVNQFTEAFWDEHREHQNVSIRVRTMKPEEHTVHIKGTHPSCAVCYWRSLKTIERIQKSRI